MQMTLQPGLFTHMIEALQHAAIADYCKMNIGRQFVNMGCGAEKKVWTFIGFKSPNETNEWCICRDIKCLPEIFARPTRCIQLRINTIVKNIYSFGGYAERKCLYISLLAIRDQV